MKIDFAQQLYSIDGRPIAESPEVTLTLKLVCQAGLLNFRPLRQGEFLSLEDQMKRYKLADKVTKGKELKSEEIVLLKEAISHWFQNPVVVGAAVNALEPEADDE